MIKILASLVFSSLIAFLISPLAFAEGVAIGISSIQGGQDLSNGTYVLGWKFRPSSAITISKLGFYDDQSNGLAASHDVGIYDSSCNLVASTTVTPSDTLTGLFRFHDITPVVLTAGETYSIVSVTNGGDKYLYNPSTVQVDSSIEYIGYAQYGAGAFPISSATLVCPNGTSTTFFYGDFGPNFYISSGDGGPVNSDKRTTALSLFCNRSGPGLSLANCTASVADKGAPPRSLPTGTINWEAIDGFSPGTAQCVPTQVSNSPGIGACDVQFSIPTGFPIGTKFPIEASYSGDTTFGVSSTSHKLIIPKCVSTDPNKPCPNSIGLSFFTGTPSVIKAKIKALISCGGTSSEASKIARINHRDASVGGTCSLSGVSAVNLDALLLSLSFDDIKAIAGVVTTAEAQSDTLLHLLRNASLVLSPQRLKLLQDVKQAREALIKDVINNNPDVRKLDKDADAYEKYLHDYEKSPRSYKPNVNKAKAPKFDKSFKSDSVSLKIDANKQKSLTFKLPKRTQSLISVYKRAGVSTLPMDVTVKAKQQKRKGSASVTETVDFVLE